MKVDYTHEVKSQSSREGGRVKLFVLHTTEGSDNPRDLADLKGLGALFDSEEASSHFGTNVEGRIARYVGDDRKAWTQCYLNPVCLSVEQIGYAGFTREQWFGRHRQLEAAAELVLHAHRKHGVPIRRGLTAGTRVIRSGVVQHKHLGALGCGHSDCGSGYPERYVRLLARAKAARRHNPRSRTARRLTRRVNRIRRHYEIAPL